MKTLILIIAILFGLTFTVYITNEDMKLIEKIYVRLIKYHDSKKIDEHI